jgi:hypothetical protein
VESVLNNNNLSSFTPNSTFVNQTDEDILVLFLINYASYPEAVDDLWFQAYTAVNNTGTLGGTIYTADLYPSCMFCSEQHQFCNPNLQDEGTGCTPLTGRTVTQQSLEADHGQSIGLTDIQWATTHRLLQSINEFTLSAALKYLGAPSMLAQNGLDTLDYFSGFASESLAVDQWRYEIINWHNDTLANMQRWVIDYVYGPENHFDRIYIVPPATPEEQAMCFNQRARFPEALSFDGVGILVILVMGSVIIVTNICLPFVVGFIQKHLRKGTYRRSVWILDEYLQLQRMAYEGAGLGSWRRRESLVPLTPRGEKFGLPALAQQGIEVEYHYVSLKS